MPSFASGNATFLYLTLNLYLLQWQKLGPPSVGRTFFLPTTKKKDVFAIFKQLARCTTDVFFTSKLASEITFILSIFVFS